MYLPQEILRARVLITVKTYPNPSAKYEELVCNAGFLESGEWIRIYPVKYRALPYEQQYRKYDWIELDLVRRVGKDPRRESYRPRLGIDEEIATVGQIGTGRRRDWQARRRYACREVFTSMESLIGEAKDPDIMRSLATVKPREIVGFDIVEGEREWAPSEENELRQMQLFADTPAAGRRLERAVVHRLPYKYYYRFLTDGDRSPRRMMIEDWEIGALYWNCLAKTDGDEEAANELVRRKYLDEFAEKDLHFFVGTTLANHVRAPNPFTIIGIFYPPPTDQMALGL